MTRELELTTPLTNTSSTSEPPLVITRNNVSSSSQQTTIPLQLAYSSDTLLATEHTLFSNNLSTQPPLIFTNIPIQLAPNFLQPLGYLQRIWGRSTTLRPEEDDNTLIPLTDETEIILPPNKTDSTQAFNFETPSNETTLQEAENIEEELLTLHPSAWMWHFVTSPPSIAQDRISTASIPANHFLQIGKLQLKLLPQTSYGANRRHWINQRRAHTSAYLVLSQQPEEIDSVLPTEPADIFDEQQRSIFHLLTDEPPKST